MTETMMKSFTKAVASSGVPEALQDSSLRSDSIKIKALSTNTMSIFIGDSGSQDYELAKGEVLDLSQVLAKNGGAVTLDMAKIYCKVGHNGDGVCVIYAARPSVGL